MIFRPVEMETLTLNGHRNAAPPPVHVLREKKHFCI